MTVQINELSPDLYLCLYRSVGWDAPGLDQIEKALEGSLATFCACDGDMPVGMARLIGDGGMSFLSRILPFCRTIRGKVWAVR